MANDSNGEMFSVGLLFLVAGLSIGFYFGVQYEKKAWVEKELLQEVVIEHEITNEELADLFEDDGDFDVSELIE